MKLSGNRRPSFGIAVIAMAAGQLVAAERTERFDKDPGWEGRNNRVAQPRTIRQDFGYSRTAHARGQVGEMGGFITAAAEPAYYAKPLAAKTFNDALTASGSFACTDRGFHILIGFFNADTLNEWRTPNTIALRLSGRGDVFYVWLEYMTARWRAGGDSPQSFPMARNSQTGREQPKGFPSKDVVRWTLKYDPNGNGGKGAITATINDVTAVCHVDDGHKADGATFNRFGLLNVMKSADDGGEVWLDDLTVNGEKEDFSRDPGWDQRHNRRTYQTTLIRPHFDFGFSPTRHAGGQGLGELGGVSFRGDCRYPERMACYGDRLEELSLAKPLKAGGKLAMRRGVTDSGVLIGFYHSRDSMKVNPSQANGLPQPFLGISTDGPSREGFVFGPCYRTSGDGHGHGIDGNALRLYPDGKSHDWTFAYAPSEAGGRGRITVTLDDKEFRFDLAKGHKEMGAKFDRFGIISTWVDGNSQTIYFDDLTYTWRQE